MKLRNKNIGPDCRSKIEDFNLKKRIVDFFRDCQITLMENEHQICFDEYIETLELSKRLIKNRGMII